MLHDRLILCAVFGHQPPLLLNAFFRQHTGSTPCKTPVFCCRSNWRYIIALVGLTFLTGAGPSNEPRIGANSNQKTENVPSAPAPATSPEEYAPCPDVNAESCYKAKNHDSADLCAQWRAAVAAEKATDAAKWGNKRRFRGCCI